MPFALNGKDTKHLKTANGKSTSLFPTEKREPASTKIVQAEHATLLLEPLCVGVEEVTFTPRT